MEEYKLLKSLLHPAGILTFSPREIERYLGFARALWHISQFAERTREEKYWATTVTSILQLPQDMVDAEYW